jgi:hypothetical protein
MLIEQDRGIHMMTFIEANQGEDLTYGTPLTSDLAPGSEETKRYIMPQSKTYECETCKTLGVRHTNIIGVLLIFALVGFSGIFMDNRKRGK